MVTVLSVATVETPVLPKLINPVPLLVRLGGVVARPLNVVTVVVAGNAVATSIPTLAITIEWVAASVTMKLNVSGPVNIPPSLPRVTAFCIGLTAKNSTTAEAGFAPVEVKPLNVESPSVQLNPSARTVESGKDVVQGAAVA